eukprot:12413425-Alexandrium_andersonii.AAC.1
MHTDCHPVSLCCWYRAPSPGDASAVVSLDAEWAEFSAGAVASLIIGDVNVRNLAWLRYSTHTSEEGRALEHWCSSLGFVECVRQPM